MGDNEIKHLKAPLGLIKSLAFHFQSSLDRMLSKFVKI